MTGDGSIGDLPGYRDVARVGSGGLGDVYRAVRISTNHPVALKVLKDVSDDSASWRRAQRELHALLNLRGHPYVVHVEEILSIGGRPVIVMEYVPGGSLADLIGRNPRGVPVGEVVLAGQQIANALAAAHRLGIVHRDIKPHNILIGAFGQVKVCDFGIAALTRSADFGVHTSAFSYRYASPEELDESPDVGPPTDIYSLGVTLQHALTGRPPSFRERDATIRRPALEWAPPTGLAPTIVTQIESIIVGAQHPLPDHRPTAPALEEAFDRVDGLLGEHRRRALSVGGDDDLTVLKTPPSRPTPPPTVSYQPTNPVLPPPGPPPPTLPFATAPPRRGRAVLIGVVAAIVTLIGIVAIALAVRNGGSAGEETGPGPRSTAPAPSSTSNAVQTTVETTSPSATTVITSAVAPSVTATTAPTSPPSRPEAATTTLPPSTISSSTIAPTTVTPIPTTIAVQAVVARTFGSTGRGDGFVTLRAAPTADSTDLGRLNEGTPVRVVCQVVGQAVEASLLETPTSLWSRTPNGEYLSSAFLQGDGLDPYEMTLPMCD
jgi:serine/threonine protein kinase